MKRLLCWLVLVILFTQTEAKAAGFDHLDVQDDSHLTIGTDTIYQTIFSNTVVVLCPDTTAISPVGTTALYTCSTTSVGNATTNQTNACITYQVGGQTGIDTICVISCDTNTPPICDTTVFIITVQVVPSPVAVDDNATLDQDMAIDIDVIANDSVFNNPQIGILSAPSNGTAIVDLTTNIITYTPDAEYCGPDVFTYVVCQNFCDSAEVSIIVNCVDDPEFKAYNSFSPNNDGRNDTFVIDGLELFPENKLFIYNRWGILIYTASPYRNEWDGTWNGEDLPDGTYFYVFDGNENVPESEQTLEHGYIQLHR